jgi:hypothetical protein
LFDDTRYATSAVRTRLIDKWDRRLAGQDVALSQHLPMGRS